MDYKEGKSEFAVLTMKHFSPYIIYDECTQDERQGVVAPMVILFVISSAVVVCTTIRSYRRSQR